VPRPAAKQLATDTSNFDGALASSETDVQKALDVLDDRVAPGQKQSVTTTDATLTTITTIPIPDNTVVLIEARIVGRRTDAAGRGIYVRRATVYREAAGAATIEGSVDTPYSRETTGSYNAQINVSGNNALIQVRGAAAHNINWTCRHDEDSAA
jgi:hypothetical protein